VAWWGLFTRSPDETFAPWSKRCASARYRSEGRGSVDKRSVPTPPARGSHTSGSGKDRDRSPSCSRSRMPAAILNSADARAIEAVAEVVADAGSSKVSLARSTSASALLPFRSHQCLGPCFGVIHQKADGTRRVWDSIKPALTSGASRALDAEKREM
jgi:hypothetical protein